MSEIYHENTSRQEIAPSDLHPGSYKPQMESTKLLDKTQIESEKKNQPPVKFVHLLTYQ